MSHTIMQNWTFVTFMVSEKSETSTFPHAGTVFSRESKLAKWDLNKPGRQRVDEQIDFLAASEACKAVF